MTTIRSLQEHWKLALGILCLGLLSLGPAQAALNGGWSTMLPYQFERITADGIGVVNGIDIEVMQAAARRAGIRTAFEEVSRVSNVQAVRAGQLDFSLAAQPQASARDWAWFTLPYRKASVAIVMRRGELQQWKGADPTESLRRLLAALPAVGGGVMRDLISGRSPIGILQSPTLLLLVLGTVLAALFIYAIHDIWGNSYAAEPAQGENDPFRWASTRGLLEVSDAIGLAAFTVTGVIVAAVQRCEPLWLWGPLLAAMTAAGGGVLRDVLRSQADIPTLKGTIYPEIALFWGLIYSLMIYFIGPDLLLSTVLMMTITVIIAGFLSRIVVVHFAWHSLFISFPERRAHRILPKR
ncbi:MULTISPECIES: TRIC cation channel family protein [Thiorhodovibrio]|uniref:TRIC cation channel family protein n=1 Tax=Thiorhodovibrio TaxID=61593 RepID=UPI00191242AC|nr:MULTISPECIES: TRIC cation channel family protein [Thiorhodovibrio]MBK5969299.1 hypothetical protein [Thiorhodovibrio winogradskyi]WPL11725.1 putative membrane protein [Thiorhodovibrio litoralis]